MTSRLRIGLLYGGQSAEHEVSVASARNVWQAIDRERHAVTLIRIDRQGRWFLQASADGAFEAETRGDAVFPVPSADAARLRRVDGGTGHVPQVDVVFPVLHGSNGEDGTIQGLLQLLDLPFVGPGALGSAAGMDKDISKRVLREAGIPVARCVVAHRHDARPIFESLAEDLGVPFFLKPANTGSSVGISKVSRREAFDAALDRAFCFDNKVLVEEFIRGREIECAVIGNEHPEVTIPGEVTTRHDFYSYEAKYLDEEATTLLIPADLPPDVTRRLRALSIATFKALCCEGMARVDLFVTGQEEIFVNELNTIPGFTQHSMFPLLWEASGLGFTQLIDRLIGLALERHARDRALRTTR